MAVVDISSSDLVTIETASTQGAQSFVPASRIGGVLRVRSANVNPANSDSANSVYRFFRVNSGDVVHKLWCSGASWVGGAPTLLVSLYNINGGAVVQSSILGSFTPATASERDLVQTANHAGSAFWQLRSPALSVDPQVEWDLCLTLVGAATTSQGDLRMTLFYTHSV